MRAIFCALTALLATVAVGQISIPGLPDCASSCVSGFGDCGQLEVECICSSRDLISDLACCVSKECNEEDQQATIDFATSICAGEDVDNLPSSATCAATASSSSQTSGSTSKSATSVVTTSAATVVTTGAATITEAAQSTTSEAAQEESSSSSAAAEATGGAMKDKIDGLGLGLVVAGLVAAL